MSQHGGMKCSMAFGSQGRLSDIITAPISLESSSPLPPAPGSCQLCPPKPFLPCAPSSSRDWECRIKGCCSVLHCMERIWCFTSEEGGKRLWAGSYPLQQARKHWRQAVLHISFPSISWKNLFSRENRLLLFFKLLLLFLLNLECPQMKHCNRDLISFSSHKATAQPQPLTWVIKALEMWSAKWKHLQAKGKWKSLASPLWSSFVFWALP